MGVKGNRTNVKPITTAEMEVAIAKHFGIRQNIIVPNISWGLLGMHECDLFIIKNSGVAVEVEIKISKSDFQADFKKGHNHVDKQNRITEFYYAFPSDLVDKCISEVPAHAGVLVCYRTPYGEVVRVKIERSPQRIKGARKLTQEEIFKVAKLGCMRIWSLKEKINKHKLVRK